LQPIIAGKRKKRRSTSNEGQEALFAHLLEAAYHKIVKRLEEREMKSNKKLDDDSDNGNEVSG
jgi:hypothetical protein